MIILHPAPPGTANDCSSIAVQIWSSEPVLARSFRLSRVFQWVHQKISEADTGQNTSCRHFLEYVVVRQGSSPSTRLNPFHLKVPNHCCLVAWRLRILRGRTTLPFRVKVGLFCSFATQVSFRSLKSPRW